MPPTADGPRHTPPDASRAPRYSGIRTYGRFPHGTTVLDAGRSLGRPFLESFRALRREKPDLLSRRRRFLVDRYLPVGEG